MRKVAVTPLLVVLAATVLLSGCDTLQARMELNRGNKYYKDEKYKDALFHFQQGLKADPSLKFAWRSVAFAAMTLYRPGNEEKENVQYADIADRATSETDRALELRARDRERKLIAKIDAALARIEDGSYGYCEETGDPIGIPRLLARPTATLSVEAQQRRELKQKMYGE